VSTPESHIPEISSFPPPPALEPIASPPPAENPPWNLWDVAGITIIFGLMMTVCLVGLAFLVHRLLAASVPWRELTKRHDVLMGAQLLTYVLTSMVIYRMVWTQTGGKVLQAIRWNWPRNWSVYLAAGVALEIGLLLLATRLPMPKHAPIEDFFQTARDAWILSLFGVLFAPLFEEIYFRGFLYPALARRLGIPISIVLTAVFFAAIHAPQLSDAWGPVLVIFLVGLTLTTVRAFRKSLAATILMHMAYNGTIFIAAYIVTDCFRHLEKMNQ